MAESQTRDVLVLYYSRSGRTKKMAEAIARELGGDLERIYSDDYPLGIRGYLRAGWDAYRGKRARFWTVGRDPSEYPLVVLGTPVWDRSLPPPVRAYLESRGNELPMATALFITHGGVGDKQVLQQMVRMLGRSPLAFQRFIEREIEKNQFRAKLLAFTGSIQRVLGQRKAA